MGAFASRSRVRVATEDGSEWIEVKAKLSAGDRERFANEVYKLREDSGGREYDISVGTAARLIMSLSFTDWLLLDEGENPQPVPFSREAISDLDPDWPIVDKALTKVAELNPTFAGQGVRTGSPNSESSTS